MKKILYILIIFLISCTSDYIKPENYNFINSKTYDKDYNYIWYKIRDFCAKNNIFIENLEKNSGDIKIDIVTNGLINSNYADCGYYFDDKYKYPIASQITLHNIIRIILYENNGKTIVNIYCFYFCNNQDNLEKNNGRCNSKGNFEKDLFEYIEK